MTSPLYLPPWFLGQGLLMTLYTSLWASRSWQHTLCDPEPPYQEKVFAGAGGYLFLAGWLCQQSL